MIYIVDFLVSWFLSQLRYGRLVSKFGRASIALTRSYDIWSCLSTLLRCGQRVNMVHQILLCWATELSSRIQTHCTHACACLRIHTYRAKFGAVEHGRIIADAFRSPSGPGERPSPSFSRGGKEQPLNSGMRWIWEVNEQNS